MDRPTFAQFVAAFGAGFRGYTEEIQDQIAQVDTGANRITWRGVHSGEFAGVPATGRRIELSAITLFKVKDGRVVGQRAQLDFFGLHQQMGTNLRRGEPIRPLR